MKILPLFRHVSVFCLVGTLACAQQPAPEAAAALAEAQAYFEEDQARKAVATLAEAALRHPEDRRLAAALYSGVRDHVWHIPQILPVAHRGPVISLAFSPDSAWLASGSMFGDVQVVSTEPLEKAAADARRITLMHESDVVGLAFAKDGRLAAVTRGAGLQLWDLKTKEVTFRGPRPDQGVGAFAVDRTGSLAAIGGNRGVIQILDINLAKLVAEITLPEKKAIKALAFSRDGKKIAAAAGGRAGVWDIAGGNAVGRAVTHETPIVSVDFSYDGRYLLTAGWDGVARLTDPASGELVVPRMPCNDGIKKATISPDGSIIATVLENASVLFWDAFTGENLPYSLEEDPPFNDFIWNRSGLRPVTISAGGHATIWTIPNGTRRGEVMPHNGSVVSALLNADSKLLATGCVDGKVRIWRTDGGMPLTTVRNHLVRARAAFYSLDGKHLVTASEDFTALHWISGALRPAGPAFKHPAKVTCATFSADATRIATCDESGLAHLWDTATHQPIGEPFKHVAAANWIDFQPDGARFVVASGSSAFVWSTTDRGKPVAVIKHSGAGLAQMKSARYSPDGKWIVTASADRTARVWDAKTFRPVGQPIVRRGAVLCARFSPDSSRLVVAGEDGQAVVYDTATWKPEGVPVLMPGSIFSAAITEDNRFLTLSAFLLEAVQFYDISTGRPLGNGVPVPSQATCVDYHLKDRVVVVACDDGSIRAVDSPFVSQDVPAWMGPFVDRLIGLKKSGPRTFDVVESTVGQLQESLAGDLKTSEQDFPKLARWTLTAGNQRTGMPRFVSTLANHIERRVEEGRMESLLECYEAVSGDALVLSALSLFTPNRRQGEFIADLVLAMNNAEPLARCYAAGTLIGAGRSAEAEAIVAQAIADAPEDPRVLRRAAKIYARVANKELSRSLFEKAVRLDPNNADTRKAFGWALYHFHAPAAAAEQFRAAQDLVGEKNDDLIAGLCLSASSLRQVREARDHYRKLIALDPAWREPQHLEQLRGWTQREISDLEVVRKAALSER